MEHPYQLVACFDMLPQPGDRVYNGAQGWCPQVALKRRFWFADGNDQAGLQAIDRFMQAVHPFSLTFGNRAQPSFMPVEVIELSDAEAVRHFHLSFMSAMGDAITNKFPERESLAFYPHMTISWQGKPVVDPEKFIHTTHVVATIWLLQQQPEMGDDIVRKVYQLR
ncbi:hypothetical protein JNJ66_03700 [Candidatus Saccharibacteria bacterium]|nr:hypothetical protein [Candidatus Saccharibacteria bacterium]